jgi:predicted transcriptional regulator
MERRRSWAFSGRLPQRIAARFTLAETAALAVIAVQVVKHAACTLTIPHIAALAGVSETTVRNAIREAKAMGLVTVEERRKTAWVSYPNTVRIVSAEWATWLRLTGAKARIPRLQEITKPSESRATISVSKAAGRAGGRSREERTRIQPRVRE